MFGWFWYILGYHVCHRFSMWECRRRDREITEEEMVDGVSQEYQERRCLECGLVQRIDLW